jgi:hypothetical protein
LSRGFFGGQKRTTALYESKHFTTQFLLRGNLEAEKGFFSLEAKEEDSMGEQQKHAE